MKHPILFIHVWGLLHRLHLGSGVGQWPSKLHVVSSLNGAIISRFCWVDHQLPKSCLISLLHMFYRYKIYIEGSAWSVSEKYILACDSPTLLVKPKYYDFFTRSLIPEQHYWPIRDDDKCRSIKFAVDWGNSHIDEVIFHTVPLIKKRKSEKDWKDTTIFCGKLKNKR